MLQIKTGIVEHSNLNAVYHSKNVSSSLKAGNSPIPLRKEHMNIIDSWVSVCEDVCKSSNIFDDGKQLMGNIRCNDDIKQFLSDSEQKEALEERVKLWLKRINDVRKNYLTSF